MKFDKQINAAWERIKETAQDPDDRANLIITKAVIVIGLSGAAPLVSWAALAAGNVAAVTILGANYNFSHGWNNKRSTELLRQMLRTASYSSLFLIGGAKIIAELLKVSGVGTIFGMAADGLLSAAVTYTALSTARDYFKQGGLDNAALKEVLKKNLMESRDAVRKIKEKHQDGTMPNRDQMTKE